MTGLELAIVVAGFVLVIGFAIGLSRYSAFLARKRGLLPDAVFRGGGAVEYASMTLFLIGGFAGLSLLSLLVLPASSDDVGDPIQAPLRVAISLTVFLICFLTAFFLRAGRRWAYVLGLVILVSASVFVAYGAIMMGGVTALPLVLFLIIASAAIALLLPRARHAFFDRRPPAQA